MTQLHFGPDRDLVIDIGEPIAIQQGTGLHRLLVPIKLLGVNDTPDGIPLSISGCAWLSMTGMEWLGTWTTERPPVTRKLESQYMLVLPLSDDQLAKIEQRRAGREVRMHIDTDVVLYDPHGAAKPSPDRWPVRSFQQDLFIHADTWQRLTISAAVMMSMALVVPVPLDASPAAMVGANLREAIRKVNDGEYGDAVVAARRAIDDMGTGWANENSVVSTARDKRSLDQRLSLLRHALFSLASPPAHGDPVAASIKWDRENAMTVIAGVAALAACRLPSPQP
jgi:hypothetical protein